MTHYIIVKYGRLTHGAPGALIVIKILYSELRLPECQIQALTVTFYVTFCKLFGFFKNI